MLLCSSAIVRFVAFQDEVTEIGALEHIKYVVEHGAHGASTSVQYFALDARRVGHEDPGTIAEIWALMAKALHPLLRQRDRADAHLRLRYLPKRRAKQIAVAKFRLGNVGYVAIDVDDEDALARGRIIPVIVDAHDALNRKAHEILDRVHRCGSLRRKPFIKHILVRAHQLVKIQTVTLCLFTANRSIIRQYAVLDTQDIEEPVSLLDVRQSVACQYRNATKGNLMVDQLAQISAHQVGARLALRVDSLIAVNVERDADIFEKPSFQELDVPVGQDREIGLERIHVFEFGPEDVLLNQIYLLIKLKRDQERLAAVPDEIYTLDR